MTSVMDYSPNVSRESNFHDSVSETYGSWYHAGTVTNNGLLSYPPNLLNTILKKIPYAGSGAAVMLSRCASADHTMQQRSDDSRRHADAAVIIKQKTSPPTVELTPVLGFAGWYKGRKCGKVGATNIHKSAISVEDPAHIWRESADVLPSYLECQPMAYADAEETAQRKFPNLLSASDKQMTFAPNDQANQLVHNLRVRLENRYPRKFKREKNLWLAFTGKDLLCTERCSGSDFLLSLSLLNMTPTDDEMKLLCLIFRSEESSDTIDYIHFINTIIDERSRLETFTITPF